MPSRICAANRRTRGASSIRAKRPILKEEKLSASLMSCMFGAGGFDLQISIFLLQDVYKRQMYASPQGITYREIKFYASRLVSFGAF